MDPSPTATKKPERPKAEVVCRAYGFLGLWCREWEDVTDWSGWEGWVGEL